MTVIGKILTFLIFFFSIVFLFMAITIVRTDRNWYEVAQAEKEEKEKMRDDVQAANKRANAANLLLKQQQEEHQLSLAAKDTTIQALNKKIATEQAKSKKLEEGGKLLQAQLDNANEELAKRIAENKQLDQLLKERDVVISDLEGKAKQYQGEAIQARLERDSYRERLMTLDKDYKEFVRKVEEERDQTAAQKRAAGKPIPLRPPPANLFGKITQMKNGLIQVDIGSDHGLLKYHTLHVYRTEPKPLYLGTMEVISVTPHKAVGQFRPARPAYAKEIQVGDKIASKIGG